MSERLFEAFREEAERLTQLPSFELIERQGHARRRRRQALVATFAACVLAVTGIVATANDAPRTQQPTEPAAPSVTPYPGPFMATLEQGTYELETGSAGSRPIVRFTVTPGWNAWQGPNRFEGIGPAGSGNEDAFGQTSWYAGLLIIEVDRMTQRDCASADVSGHNSPAFAQALTRMPGLDVTSGPEHSVRFGRPTIHLRLRASTEPSCPWFFLTPFGYTGGTEPGSHFDAWVVDVDGRPLLVWADWTPNAPRADVRDLLAVIDTIEVLDRDAAG